MGRGVGSGDNNVECELMSFWDADKGINLERGSGAVHTVFMTSMVSLVCMISMDSMVSMTSMISMVSTISMVSMVSLVSVVSMVCMVSVVSMFSMICMVSMVSMVSRASIPMYVICMGVGPKGNRIQEARRRHLAPGQFHSRQSWQAARMLKVGVPK